MLTFKEFIKECSGSFYPEPSSTAHEQLSDRAVQLMRDRVKLGGRVLDIGIGKGYALKSLVESGFDTIGITVAQPEVDEFEAKGFDVRLCDMHDISNELGTFNGVIARHVLEHSPAPLYVLRLIYSVMADGGVLYVEVPAGETCCHHEQNPNHYSIMTFTGWAATIMRAGFKVDGAGAIPLLIPSAGVDTYLQFVAIKCATS